MTRLLAAVVVVVVVAGCGAKSDEQGCDINLGRVELVDGQVSWTEDDMWLVGFIERDEKYRFSSSGCHHMDCPYPVYFDSRTYDNWFDDPCPGCFGSTTESLCGQIEMCRVNEFESCGTARAFGIESGSLHFTSVCSTEDREAVAYDIVAIERTTGDWDPPIYHESGQTLCIDELVIRF